MGMTQTQKILAARAGLDTVEAGQLVEAKLDAVLGNDVTTPVAVDVFESSGFTTVFDREKVFIVLDHYTPCKDIASAKLCKRARDFAMQQKITHFYDTGAAGIEHALLPEKGLVIPGDCMIGADSHTCTYGALGAFSTGVGSTDMAAAMASGTCWFRVPSALRIVLKGRLQKDVSGKDVILHLIGRIIEAGAKNGIFPVDEATRAYLEGRTSRPYTVYEADPDAEYEKTVEIDLDALEPTVSLPHLPSNTKPAREVRGMKIDQAVIGSCTNGRISDMRCAAEILRNRHIAPGVRCIVIPATQEVYLQCVHEGLADIFVNAGCALSTPTCGPCLGGHMGCMCDGERAVSTTNRNFVGRMGAKTSEVILASPAVAAASAVKGAIALPSDLD